jgi:DNA repair photolyase
MPSTVIREFDPWGDSLCTCPKKYSLNPYTGCGHACIYCYITSYIPAGHNCRVKPNLLRDVRRGRRRLDPKLYISMSNSSDPYTPMEKEYRLTRSCLKLLRDFKVLIITKSDLVTRDIDLLRDMHASVSMTITTLDEDIGRKLEPFAPSPEKRLKALEELIGNGIKVSCRVDSIIPYVNEDASTLIKELSQIGVSHVVSSTFKPRPDAWRRFENAFEKEAESLKNLYFKEGFRHQNAFYLPTAMRFEAMKGIRRLCDEHGMTFATCREGFKLNTSNSCDGSHLI